MSRQKDSSLSQRRPLLASQRESPNGQAAPLPTNGGPEKTPLLNSMGAAAESLVNNSVMGADIQATGVSWGMAAFLLVNTALGAGMLNYPFAYNQIGSVWAAALMQVILLIFITSTMFILVYCADFNRDDTYHDVLLSMCGKRAQQISALSIMLTCYGINITFLVIIGDQYDRIFHSLLAPELLEWWFLDRKFSIFLTAVLFIWPMCYAQRLDFLRHASVLGMFAMLYVTFLTIYEHYVLDEATIAATISSHNQQVALGNGTALEESSRQHVQWFQPLAIVPVLCFAYQTHEVIVPVYACMRERYIGSFMKASIFGLVILFFLYNLVGAFGYLTFGDQVGADIMSLYDAKDPVVVVGVVALVIKFITTYPPLMFCGRSALDGLYGEFRQLSTHEFKTNEQARRVVISTLWFVTTVALAVFAPDISVTLQLLGSMASINVFVFPGMCLLSLTRRLRRARQSLLMGELPEGFNSQQRAKDYYLISGSYFGAAMRKNAAAMRNHQRLQQQQQQQQLQHAHHQQTPSSSSASQFVLPPINTNPRHFTATFASLIEFENNCAAEAAAAAAAAAATTAANNCNGTTSTNVDAMCNGNAGSSGRGTGEILSSISRSSSADSSLNLAHDLKASRMGGKQQLVNGYGATTTTTTTNGEMSQTSELEQSIRQVQRRQQEFHRLMTNGALMSLNSSTQAERRSGGLQPLNAVGHGKTINDSYEDYSQCLNGHTYQHDKSSGATSKPLLISHKSHHQLNATNTRRHATGYDDDDDDQLGESFDDQMIMNTGLISDNGNEKQKVDANGDDDDDYQLLDRPTTMSQTNNITTTTTTTNAHHHCQQCCHQFHQLSYQQQASLCLQNSLNYALANQSTITHASLLDKLGSTIAPSTVAQMGISRCTATGLYLYAILLILFGAFIFFLELATVFGLV